MLAQTAKLPSGSQCEPKEAIVNLHENNVQVLQVEYVNEVKWQHVTQRKQKMIYMKKMFVDWIANFLTVCCDVIMRIYVYHSM